MNSYIALLGLLVTGCGTWPWEWEEWVEANTYDEDRFAQEMCLKLQDCDLLGGATTESCVALFLWTGMDTAERASECEYSFTSAEARSCLSAMDSVSCGQLEAEGLPGACDGVCGDE
jgi:hypothetical protein